MIRIILFNVVFFVVVGAATYFFSLEADRFSEPQTLTSPPTTSAPSGADATAIMPVSTDDIENSLPLPVSLSQVAATEDATEGDSETLALPDRNPAYATFGDRYAEISARREGRVPPPQILLNASQHAAVWQSSEKPSQLHNLSDEDATDGREFIQFNPLKLESLVAGDQFEISLSQTARTYNVIVDEVESYDNGRNVTWRGRLEGVEGFNQVSLTRGEKGLVVGGLTTPDGNFQIEVHGDQGWVANSATLFKGVDQQVIVPPELIENPPSGVVYLPAETFSEHDITTH
ncbi:MAG: hypothetical protein IPM37_14695 [Hahellaceae bacterium]|nr:hypothetical protein [Hahellaceae bacterium]